MTLTLPYEALDLSGAFAERKQLHVTLPELDTTPSFTKVFITFPDGTVRFFLEADRGEDEEAPETRTSERVLTLNNLQLKSEATSGTLSIRVRSVEVAEDVALGTAWVPSGFVLEDVVTGLNGGVVFDFAPDGRIFISEKGGAVRVFKDGKLNGEPFIRDLLSL